MTNFLGIDKNLFKLGLNPTQILIVAQIMEFERNTGDCFISNERLSEQFGISVSTIKREIKKLEDDGFIIRDTKNIQKGKERHLRTNSTKLNLNLVNETNDKSARLKLNLPQSSNCPLRKEQNEPIKDNNKNINLKDNEEILSTNVDKISYEIPEVEEARDGSNVNKAIPIAKEEAKKMIECGSTYRQVKEQLFIIDNLFYLINND